MARVEQSIEVNVPPRTAWEMLTSFEQYPRFMQGVEEVRRLDERRLRWHTREGGLGMHWDAEITQQVPEQRIAWRNMDGPRNEGEISLQRLDGDCTRIVLSMDREALQADAGARAEQDLVRLKQFIEKLGRDSGEWRGREQDGMPSHSAPAEFAAGNVTRMADTTPLHAVGSLAQQPDAPQQAFGADEADNARGGAGSLQGRRSASGMLPGLFRQRWQDPLSTMRRMSDNVEQVMTTLAAASGLMRGRETAPGAWLPRIEIVEDPLRILVCAELPGVARDEITVEVRGGELVIEGARGKPANVTDAGSRCSEFRYGRFHRAVALPPDADPGAVSAELRHGVLQVTVLRHPMAGGKRIDISEG
ncbi:hypothetical protein NCCP691_37640 [Noviherbaspirillum aridicola]|uniref:SHSP domain-containing protein n=2 Tax=Noviherbaspirillum aridicola TaxID=2849687 RepID=A0ABQ4QAD0_9BURK|nr:hypothetical protein NCCP691_37640 [Noviherbaspirillum aridicola]